MASKDEATALLVDVNGGSGGPRASKPKSTKAFPWTATVATCLVVAGICADETARFAVNAYAGYGTTQSIDTALWAVLSPSDLNNDPRAIAKVVQEKNKERDDQLDAIVTGLNGVNTSDPVELKAYLHSLKSDASLPGGPEETLPDSKPVTPSLPDFGDDTDLVLSALNGLEMVTTGDETNPELTQLTVDFAGIKIDGGLYEALTDKPWLERVPLVSWGEMMSGPQDGTKYTVAVFDADADTGIQGVGQIQRNGTTTNLHHNFLQALWVDCEGGSNIACGTEESTLAPYVMPAPPATDAPHKIIFLLFKQNEREDGVLNGVKFWLDGAQLYHRDDRMHELVKQNPHLQPVAVTYMKVDGKNHEVQ